MATERSRSRGRSATSRYIPASTRCAASRIARRSTCSRDLDRRCALMDPRVAQVIASLAGVYEIMLVQASDGTLAADVRPLVRLNVSVIMERTAGASRATRAAAAAATSACHGRRAAGQDRGGSRALGAVNMEAVPSPAGNMPVVLGSGLARHPAARGDRPRARGRLQPQGHVRVQRHDRRARRDRAVHRGRRWHAQPAGAARSTSTTRVRRRSATR